MYVYHEMNNIEFFLEKNDYKPIACWNKVVVNYYSNIIIK